MHLQIGGLLFTAIFSLAFAMPVLLDPSLSASRSVLVCLGSMPVFVCNTTEGSLLWETSSTLVNCIYDNNLNRETPKNLGVFTVYRDEVFIDMNTNFSTAVNSRAILTNPVQLSQNDVTLRCSENTDLTKFSEVVLNVGPPPAPTVTSITLTQSSTNSSSLLISWSMSDCAVQYVVTIINSSDDSVYLNITTSDTNTTVTGVEFCVTVLGVDSIGRRGPASEPQCYTIAPTSTISDMSTVYQPSSISVTTSTSPTVSPVLMGGVNAAAVAVPIVLILLLVVIATAVGVALLVYFKRKSAKVRTWQGQNVPTALEHGTEMIEKPKEYVYQVFCHEDGTNQWRFVFVFVESKHLDAARQYYTAVRYIEYDSDISFEWESDDIEVTTLAQTGWISSLGQHGNKVSRANVEGYTGKGEPPYCEMNVKNVNTKTTPPDLHIVATINGTKDSAKIEIKKDAQKVVECVCQVFYHKLGLNWWKATLAFFPKELLRSVNSLYQVSNNSLPAIDVISDSTSVIKLSIGNEPTEWKLFDVSKLQVNRAAIVAYTGVGKPPYCEMTLRAADGSTPSDLTLPVTLTGVKQPTTITLERVAETTDGVVRRSCTSLAKSHGSTKLVCQVFYHKKGNNYWKATFAFYPEDKVNRVKQFYQDANLGPTIDLHFAVATASFTVRDHSKQNEPWKSYSEQLGAKVTKHDILSYTGEGKPTVQEVTFRPVSIRDTPPDLDVTMVLHGIKSPANKLQIERMAEAPTDSVPSSPQNDSPHCMCQVFYYKIKNNYWRIVFTFFSNLNLDNVKLLYHDAECGPFVDHLVLQHNVVEIVNPIQIMGWTVTDKRPSVSRADIEGYTGKGGLPPYCEMTLNATGVKEQHGDLQFGATIKGMETSPSPIMIERPYEQSAAEQDTDLEVTEEESHRRAEKDIQDDTFGTKQQAPSTVMETFQCVCQVFYHKKETNWWKIKFAFCSRKYLDDMKAFYSQNAVIGECVDVQFKDSFTPIRLPSEGVIVSGWKVTVEQQNDCNQVTTAAVEQYTGEGEPPYCEMTLRADDDNTTYNGNFTVTLNGVRATKNIKIMRRIELDDDVSANPVLNIVDPSETREYICQVFYAKYGINTCKIIFSFIPKGNLEEVKKCWYSYEEVGPTVDVQLNKEIVKVSAGKASNGWSYDPYYEQVKRADIEAYTGVGKPPYCEMTLTAADGSTPPDLTLPVTLTGVKQPTTIILERVATADMFGKSEQEVESYDSTKYMCQVFYHKEETNNWKATIAFFTKEKQTNVNTVYQSEVTGPTAEFQFKRGSNSSVKVGYKKLKAKEWNVTISPEHDKVTRAAVDAYGRSGSYTTDKPPYCEMILRAVSDSTPPPDLTVSLTLNGGNLLEPITLEREAEHPSPPLDSTRPQAATRQDSKSHEENNASNSDKNKHKSSDSAEPQSQDIGAGSLAGSDLAPLPNPLQAPPLVSSHSPSSIQSGTEPPQQKDNDQPENAVTSSNGNVNQQLVIVKHHYEKEN